LSKTSTATLCPIVDAKFCAQATALDQLPAPTYVEVAFAGRSNVGKSSLLNALFERRNLVRTSQTPGCTQGVNFFEVRTRDGRVAHFVDLPGYGYAERSKSDRRDWGTLVDGYLSCRPTLRAVVLLVDVRRDFGAEERQLLDWLALPTRVSRQGLGVIIAATKTDQLTSAQVGVRLQQLSAAAASAVLGVSVREQRSVDRLRQRVLSLLVESR
jgi:GTP-binding protein